MRAVTVAVIFLLAAVAVHIAPTVPDRRPADVLLQGEASSAAPRERHDTLGRGESLANVFVRAGLSDSDATLALQAAVDHDALDERRIPAGMPVVVMQDSAGAPSEVVLQLSLDHFLTLRRGPAGWAASEERLPWKTDTIVVGGTINSTLYQAIDDAAHDALPTEARRQLTWTLADVYEYRVDMSRDLQVGDRFRVMVERAVAPTGAVRAGKILVATLQLSGSTMEAIRYSSRSATGDYFDQTGKSLRAAFLRAPLEFRRISSTFGSRRHPILGYVRQHKGTDYAANIGTPVRAIGDGVVTRAGWGGGYGNVLEIRHRNGFVTRYGHLRGYAKGIRGGTRVTIGQTVAYVGTTGMSTGPHLHFEVLVNGVQRDPRVALRSTGGDPIPSGERDAFMAVRGRMLAALATDRAERVATR